MILVLNLLKHISIISMVEVISRAPPSGAALSVKSQMKLHVESLKLISPSPHTEKCWKFIFRYFFLKIPNKGLFTYYDSRWRGGEGVSQKMTIADEGRRGGRPKDDDC